MESPSPIFRRTWQLGTIGLTAALALAALQQSAKPVIFGRWSSDYAMLLAVLAALVAAAWLGCLAPVQGRIWAARGRLILLSASLLGALALGEVALRTVDPMGLNYHDEIASYIALRQDDAVLEYVQPKSLEVQLDGVPVRFNSLGLRGPELGPKEAGSRRLLVLGDSVAFGWGVEEEHLFTSHLASLLGEQTGESWTPINAGVCSYNTEQERLYLEHRGLALEPDLVVLVYVDNDVVTYGERWEKSERAKPPLRRRIKRALQQSRLVQTLAHVAKRGDAVELEGVERALGPDDAGWQRNMTAMEELVALCAQQELPLAIYHFRWRSDPWSDALLEAARTHAAPVPVVDTAPWFSQIDLKALVNSVTDSHPNARAHALTAQQMHADLEQRKLPVAAAPR